MFKDLAEIAPKALVISVAAWGVANYFLIAPEIASRIVRADHLPQCERGYRDMAAKSAEKRAAAIPPPRIDAARQLAAEQARRMLNSPFMQDMRGMSQGMGDYLGFNGAVEQTLALVDQQSQAARDAYEQALARVKAETATDLAKSGDVCGCIGDQAIGETRSEWAIFSGTLAIYRPAGLRNFDQTMAQIHTSGACAPAKAGS